MADALRAAKQAALQAKLASARREAEASGLASSLSAMGTASWSSSSLGGGKRPSVGGVPTRPSLNRGSGARRPSTAPSFSRHEHPGGFSDDEVEDDGMYGGGGGGRGGSLSHCEPQHHQHRQQQQHQEEDDEKSNSSRNGYPGGGNGGRASTDGNIRPKRPSAAASIPKRAKKNDFVIPKKNPTAAAVAAAAVSSSSATYQHIGAGDDGFIIPRREDRDTYGGSSSNSNSDAYGSDPHMPLQPPTPAEKGGGFRISGGGEIEFPHVQGKSLDRARFPAQWLVRGLKEEWDSREEEKPLVVPLADFGLQKGKHILALRITIAADAKRFAVNLCPGPLPPDDAHEPAPKEILAHINPRRIYKNGSIVYNSRHSGSWTDDPPPTVPLKGLPPVFLGVPVTLLISLDKDLISLSVDDQTACEIFLNTDGRGKMLSRLTQLALHLPTKEESVGFQEEIVVHEVWWSPDPPTPPDAAGAGGLGGGAGELGGGAGGGGGGAGGGGGGGRRTDLLAPEVARAAAAAAAAMIEVGSGSSGVGREGGAARLQQQLPLPLQQPTPASYGPPATTTPTVTSGANRGDRDEGNSSGGGGGSDINEVGMGATLSRLGGLLGQGGGAAGGMAVVAVSNLPESTGEEVEKVKADLWALVGGVGQGPREVHLKVGASTAFVVLTDAGDLGETVRRLDWTEYGGKKIRLARSNKRSFS
ncbi:hypothetical protein VYU27_005492 [Nannochloropsis oceanica]